MLFPPTDKTLPNVVLLFSLGSFHDEKYKNIIDEPSLLEVDSYYY
jgi:hypothetical protein